MTGLLEDEIWSQSLTCAICYQTLCILLGFSFCYFPFSMCRTKRHPAHAEVSEGLSMGGVPASFVLKQAFPTLSACDLLGRTDFIATTRSAEIRTLQQGNFVFEYLLRSPPKFFCQLIGAIDCLECCTYITVILFDYSNILYIYIYIHIFFLWGRVLCYLTGCLQPPQVHWALFHGWTGLLRGYLQM